MLNLKYYIASVTLLLFVVGGCTSKENDASIIRCNFEIVGKSYFNVDDELKFSDKSSATTSQIVNWSWDFGDGTTSVEKSPNHIYSKAQVYTVTLTIKDDQNNSKTISKILRVNDSRKGLRRIMYETSDTIYVCSHRAVHLTIGQGDFPENSMTGIKKAIENKIDIFECDIRATADGALVLMHDATIDRTTTGSGTLSKMNYSDIRLLKLKNYSSGIVSTDTIPTLRDVLLTSKNKIYIALDIDGKAPVASVLKMVDDMEMIDHVLFFTSSMSDVSYLLANGAIVMPSCYNNTTFNSYLQNGLQPLVFQVDNQGYNEEWLSIKSKGIKLYNNVYLNSPTLPTSDNWVLLNTDIQNGVNIVQTDYPIEMLNYLKSIKRH